MKRLFDVVASSLFLLLVSPIFLVCMVAVKLSSDGPIFYTHMRVGRGGKLFGCLKFRTMYRDAAEKLRPILAANPQLQAEWQTYFKLKEDPRITFVGKFLRKTSLDELPQVWNVLKGEMSVVGPRPLTQHEVSHYLGDKAELILSVRPGLTTLWITEGRNRLSLEERVKLEEYYVINRNFLFDIKLIFKTLLTIIKSSGI